MTVVGIPELLTATGMIIYIVIVVLLLKYRLLAIRRSKKEEKKGRIHFYEALNKMFDSDLIKDKSDIEILKSAIEREADTVYSLAPILEDYLVYLGEPGSQESQLSERYQLIKGIIATENADKPFADIPEEERRLLIAMRAAIPHNDKDSAMSFNLKELSSVISTRSRDYERVMNANRWLRPLTIGALIASIFFGIIGIIGLL